MKLIGFIVSRHSFGTRAKCVPKESRLYFCVVETGHQAARQRKGAAATTMETYFQDPPSSCMSCRQAFNARGRDFVGILGSFR